MSSGQNFLRTDWLRKSNNFIRHLPLSNSKLSSLIKRGHICFPLRFEKNALSFRMRMRSIHILLKCFSVKQLSESVF